MNIVRKLNKWEDECHELHDAIERKIDYKPLEPLLFYPLSDEQSKMLNVEIENLLR